MPEGQPDPKELGYYFALAHVGLEMVFPMGIGIVLDYYAHWTPAPWATVIGLFLGFIGGFAHLMVLVNQHDKADRSPKSGGQRP